MKKKDYITADIFKIPFRISPRYAFLIALKKMIDGLIPSVQVIVVASFLDTAMEIVKHNKQYVDIVISISLLIFLIAYRWLSDQLIKFGEVRLELHLKEKLKLNIIEKTAKLKYKYIENAETWDLISRVSKEPEVIIKNAYINALAFISMILKVVGLLFIVITQVWWVGIVILSLSIPLIFLALKGGKASYNANREVSKYIRKYQYLGGVLTGRESASERTLFGFTDKINEKWKKQYENARKIQFKTDLKHFIRLKSGSVITAGISILMSIVLIKPVLDGIISVGMFIALVNGIISLIQLMSWELSFNVRELSKNREYIKDLRSFYKLEELDNILELPLSKKIEIESLEFNRVFFKYPNTESYILKDLSFKIQKGKHYAFVGTNGSGKTTVIKLITGLYKDFKGEILINGKSIKDYTERELKSMYSVVYQDFARYYISAKENISIGDINHIGEEIQEEKISDSIRIMNLQETLESLPEKGDTPLGRIKTGGCDLSGGQWQRVAMARSIISSASLRILDEPTAALDPISESNIYKEFEEISKGGTTIFISHRLGSTKLAEKIFVLGNGTVIEKGAHDELMEMNGVYAEMYKSQRSWYLS